MAMPKRARAFAFVAILGASISIPAHANFTCEGPITYLGLGYEANLTVSVGYGIWTICNLSSPMSNGGIAVNTDACKAWYASFLAAQKASTQVRIYFVSTANTTNGPECSAIGSWVQPNPLPYFVVPL
jgi:hypothetical protein